MGGGPPHPLGPGGMPMGPGMQGMPHPGLMGGFPPGMNPGANFQQMLALSGVGGPGLHPAVSSAALALMPPGGPPDSGRQSEMQHRASALSSNPGSSLYLDHDRRNSISPSSPPDVKENEVPNRPRPGGDRGKGAIYSGYNRSASLMPKFLFDGSVHDGDP